MLAFNSHFTMQALPTTALVKIPRQRRSIDMVHAIIDAAIQVVASEGVAHFSTNRVASVAGVSIGSLYQYFANKEMILAAVLERGILESEDLMRRLATADPDASIDDVLRRVLHALIAELEPARPLIRDVLSVVPLVNDGGILSVLETRVGDVVRDYLLRHHHRYHLVGGPAALYVGINAIVYVFLKWLTEPHRSIDKDEFVEAVVAILVATIRPAESPRS